MTLDKTLNFGNHVLETIRKAMGIHPLMTNPKLNVKNKITVHKVIIRLVVIYRCPCSGVLPHATLRNYKVYKTNVFGLF